MSGSCTPCCGVTHTVQWLRFSLTEVNHHSQVFYFASIEYVALPGSRLLLGGSQLVLNVACNANVGFCLASLRTLKRESFQAETQPQRKLTASQDSNLSTTNTNINTSPTSDTRCISRKQRTTSPKLHAQTSSETYA
jgi:hypothetical protein